MPIKLFLIFYQVTFGLYLYFWFLGNYRDFVSYKKLKLNPELLALGLFVFTILPYFIYGVIQKALDMHGLNLVTDISFDLVIAGTEAAFLFFQFQIFSGFLKKKLTKSFSVTTIVLGFFILSGLKKVLPMTVPFYIFWEMVLILIQGGILAIVQRDLNLYWRIENEQTNRIH